MTTTTSAPTSAAASTTTTVASSSSSSIPPNATTTTAPPTTALPPAIGFTASPPPALTVEELFVEDKDSANSARGMALASLVFSALAGNYPNGILAMRASIFLNVCIRPPTGAQELLQLPVVAALGEEESVKFYFGSAVFNPVLFVALCGVSVIVGLMISSARGIDRRQAASIIYFPAHLAIPVGVMIVPGMFCSAVAMSTSSDPTTIAMSVIFGFGFWCFVLFVMAALILTRFRAVYVRRMETVDESGNVTTVRRKIRNEREEVADRTDQDKRSEDASMFSGAGGVGASFFSKSFAADGSSGDHLSDRLLNDDVRSEDTQSFAFLKSAREAIDRLVAKDVKALGVSQEVVDNADAEDEETVRKREAVLDARKVADITDTVLRAMFFQAKRVGTDRLVLLYSVQGHFEWADDDEVDTEAVQREADRVGMGYDEAFAQAEEQAKAARGYVQRFGTFFQYYRRKFRHVFILELTTTAMLAFFSGLHGSPSLETNCYVQTSLMFTLLLADLVAHVLMCPHISGLNNTYCNGFSFFLTFGALMNIVAVGAKNLGAARTVQVLIVLLVYVAALRALLDLYVYANQRLFESGVEWPSLAKLTDIHIKWQRANREDVLQFENTKQFERIQARRLRRRKQMRGEHIGEDVAHDEGEVSPAAAAPADKQSARDGQTGSNAPTNPNAAAAAAPATDVSAAEAAVTTTEKWKQLRDMQRAHGVASRSVPPALLPFEMEPLPHRVTVASRHRAEAWERRRKELRQKLKWANTLRSLRHAGGGSESDETTDTEEESSTGSAGMEDGGQPDHATPSAALPADDAGTGGGGRVPTPKAAATGMNHPHSSGIAAGGGKFGAGPSASLTVTEHAIARLLQRAEREELAKRRHAALTKHAAETIDDLALEEDGHYADESRSMLPRLRGVSTHDPAITRERAKPAAADRRQSAEDDGTPHAQPAAASPEAGAPRSGAPPLLGGDLDGWSDLSDEDDAAKNAAGATQPATSAQAAATGDDSAATTKPRNRRGPLSFDDI